MIYKFDDLSFQILTIDRFYHNEGRFFVQERSYAALSFRTKGEGRFKIGGKNFLSAPGDVLFIPAYMPYEVDYSVSESIVADLKSCNYTEPEVFRFKNSAEGALLFSDMLSGWQDGFSVNQAKAAIYNILEKAYIDNTLSGEEESFSLCLRYIDEHYSDASLDIGEICQTGFISKSTLQRAFLQRLGVSPKQYIIGLRMNKALKLLIENKLSVREIALKCGFEDEKYFSRAFKNKYGHPPSQILGHISL
jgi:AraC-like DNA-binding protein